MGGVRQAGGGGGFSFGASCWRCRGAPGRVRSGWGEVQGLSG